MVAALATHTTNMSDSLTNPDSILMADPAMPADTNGWSLYSQLALMPAPHIECIIAASTSVPTVPAAASTEPTMHVVPTTLAILGTTVSGTVCHQSVSVAVPAWVDRSRPPSGHLTTAPSATSAGIMRLVMLLIVSLRLVQADHPVFNVVDYGAAGNGNRDDTKAFLEAWGHACANSRSPTFLIPSGKTFLLREVVFGGPCSSKMHVQVSGNIVAPNKLWTNVATNLLTFININRLTMDGSGLIDGRGPIWWACLAKNRCKNGPTTLGFLGCNNLQVIGIKIKDSPGKQLTIYKSVGVLITGVTITAPEDSPNTDGMLITESQHVQVLSSTIGTGDDCIAIGPGSSDVNISGITCGPGHGISIGSLGQDGSKAMVERVHVSHSNIFQALTGVRIKTWQGGSGFAKGVLFENINFTSVKTPIVIDQFYCPQGGCPNKTSSVAVSDVRFLNLHGTATTDVAIRLACSRNVPCSGIILQEVSFTLEGSRHPPRSYCINARGSAKGRVIPEVPCLD